MFYWQLDLGSKPRRDRGCAQLVGELECCHTPILTEDLVIGIEMLHSTGQRSVWRILAIKHPYYKEPVEPTYASGSASGIASGWAIDSVTGFLQVIHS